MGIVKQFLVGFFLLCAVFTGAQNFNVDFEIGGGGSAGYVGVPSSQFGAAAEQPGHWNSLFSEVTIPKAMLSLNGLPTNVSMTSNSENGWGNGAVGWTNNALTGDYAKLINDYTVCDSGGWKSYTFHGLENGRYRVWLYMVRPAPQYYELRASLNNGPLAMATGPLPTNALIVGVTHTVQDVIVTNGILEIKVFRPATGNFALSNGVQITLIPGPTQHGPVDYDVANGLAFSGNLMSLMGSDNNRLSILNDSDDSIGEIHFFSSLSSNLLTELKFKLEGRATRTDLSQLVDMYNYDLGEFVNVHFRVTSLFDSIVEGSIASNPRDFINPMGEMTSRVLWIPNQDMVSGDGWTESVDQVVWTAIH